MAIYYSPLFCPKGSILEATKEINFDTFTVKKGQKCYVYDIKGYGYDIHALWEKDKVFRIVNSEINNYFKLILSPMIEKLEIASSDYKAKFKKDFAIKNVIKFKKGTEFYFEVDRMEDDYFDLYDEFRKVLRLKESEAREYIEFMDNVVK